MGLAGGQTARSRGEQGAEVGGPRLSKECMVRCPGKAALMAQLPRLTWCPPARLGPRAGEQAAARWGR